MQLPQTHSAPQSTEPRTPELILLTGATGYIGGRLLPALLEQGYQVRCLARRPEHLSGRAPGRYEVVAADLTNAATLAPALVGVTTAFYLIHSMGSEAGFAAQDRLAAQNFAHAARAAGVRRIIYLGGLGGDQTLSAHLASRQEVGAILRASGVPTLEFRASIIIGSGSLSFEMVRALVTRLPIMTTPRWVRSLTQPIAVEDVLAYCLAAITLPGTASAVYEIGGPDRVSYADLMREYARQVGLRRLIIPVPVLSPGLSSLWLGLITPLYARVGRKLIDSVKHDTIVKDDRALRDFAIRPRGLRDAMARALAKEDQEYAQTRWSDALSSAGNPKNWGGVRFGRRLIDRRRIYVPVAPAAAF
ncbi:MAG: NAD(P)H-binding protein, partial [Phycisphaerae bacterium]